MEGWESDSRDGEEQRLHAVCRASGGGDSERGPGVPLAGSQPARNPIASDHRIPGSLDRVRGQAATGALGALHSLGLDLGRILEPDSGGDLLARRPNASSPTPAVGDEPDLEARGRGDGVGRSCIAGCSIEASSGLGQDVSRLRLRSWNGWPSSSMPRTSGLALADRYRQAEAMDALDAAGVGWPVEWRAQGSGKDGSADIRAFGRAVEGGSLRPGGSLALAAAIRESEVRFDNNGNPSFEQGPSNVGASTCLSAAVLAIGAGSRAVGARSRNLVITTYLL